MSETKQPTADKQEAYQAFIEHYNLNPSNNDAIMNCLFEQNQKFEEISTMLSIIFVKFWMDEKDVRVIMDLYKQDTR